MTNKRFKLRYAFLALSVLVLLSAAVLYFSYRASKERATPWLHFPVEMNQIRLAVRMYQSDYPGQIPPNLKALVTTDCLTGSAFSAYNIIPGENNTYLIYRTSPLPELHKYDLYHIFGIDDIDEAIENAPDVRPPSHPCTIVVGREVETTKIIPEDDFPRFLKDWTENNAPNSKTGLVQPDPPAASP